MSPMNATDVIEANAQRARELLAGAGPEGLTGDALAEFEACEARARTHLEMERRAESLTASPLLTAGVAAGDGTDVDEAPPATSETRAVGNLPDIAFADADIVKMHKRWSDREPAEVRAIATPAPPTGAASPSWTDKRFAPFRLASIIPAQNVDHRVVTYYRQTANASAAAPVAEGGQKPESTPAWTPTEATVRKLAHWSEVSTEGLADYGNFASIIQQEMVAGLIHAENGQLLNGSGAGENLLGILGTPGILTYAPAAAEARLLSILHALTMLEDTGSAFTGADAILLTPSDWKAIQAMQATGGELIVNPTPATATQRSLFGVPVHLSTGLAAGTALVGNFAESAVLFSREAANVKIDPYSASTENMVKFIGEERLALGVTRPNGFVRVTFNV